MVQLTERVEERYEAQDVPFGKLLGVGMKRKGTFAVGVLLILVSLLTITLATLGLIPA